MKFKVLRLFAAVVIVAGLICLDFNRSSAEILTTESPSSFTVAKAYALDVHKVDAYLIGKMKNVRGIVTKANGGNGNFYFTLRDVRNNATIKGVLFKKTLNKNPEYKSKILQSLNNQSVVYLNGKIDAYNGELEIITWNVWDYEMQS